MSHLERVLKEQEKFIEAKSEITGYLLKGIYKEGEMMLQTSYRFSLPSKMRIEVITPDGNSYTEGFNGTKAWELDKYVDGRKAAALRHNANYPKPIKSLNQCAKLGLKLEYNGLKKYKETKFESISFTQLDGFTREYFIDPESYLIRYGLDRRPLHPDDPVKAIETEFINYKEFNGLMFPMTSFERDVEKNEIMTEIQWERVELNPEFKENEFDKR